MRASQYLRLQVPASHALAPITAEQTTRAAGAPQEGGRARGQGVVGPVSRPSQFLQDLEPDLEPLEPDLEPESTVA